ncbi:MAG: aminodeoxychorismate synthase, component I [Chloroflexi bacterium]|nr:aminodeoxychorismate synthase, component I [Chloroflexota bacterium]
MSYQPFIEEVSPVSSLNAFEGFRDRPFAFFLDSGMAPEGLGRYSFMGSDPFLVLRSRGQSIDLLWPDGRMQSRVGDPFDFVGGLLREYALPPIAAPVPFWGGAVGYFSYDLCHFIERLPATAADDLGLPQCYLAFYDAVVAFDHLEGRAYVISTGMPQSELASRRRRAQARLEETRSRLQSLPVVPDVAAGAALTERVSLRSNFSREGYLRAVNRARDYIIAGDIFQVNLSQRFETELSVPAWELYRRLRRVNPAPFAAYLDFDGLRVVSASPERFLRLQGDLVETRPIKGTRPRGRTTSQDKALARELVTSAKDRAENVMIVDLERNDMGRVCRYGTVWVRELAALERYATVFHLTSTVEGRLRPDRDRIDLLRATFPGGSITGAPKVRAMEIIDELEPTRRSVYTGAIGYLGFDGGMDLNIVIRTILVAGKRAYFQVGGGIVYDSDPEAEYQETLDKAQALVQALSLSPQPVEAK